MKLLTTTFTSSPYRLHSFIPTMSRSFNQNNNANSGRRQNNRNDDPIVRLSKSLSWILRHGLDQSGLQARSDGYVRLDELVHPIPTKLT
jgi:2'-phosphotransferase